MPRVLLAGAFGQRNPGDDALLRAFIAALPGWQAVVPSQNPAAVTAHEAVAVRTGPYAAASAVLGVDAVVFAGGTVFKLLHESTGRGRYALLARGLALACAAHALGRPVALVGVGAATLPDRRSRALTRALASVADMLVLRDVASAELLAAAGVPQPLRVGADAAWTLFEHDAQQPPRPARGPLVLSVSRHCGTACDVPLLAAGIAAEVVDRPDVDGIVLEPWQVGGPGLDDLDLARAYRTALEVAGAGRVAILPPPESLVAASAAYRGARAVVGERFHALVAAAAAGCPFAAVAHEPKLADLAGRLGQASLRPESSVGEVRAAVRAALDGPPPPTAAVAETTLAARTMLDLMRAVAEGGRAGCPEHLERLRLHPGAVVR